MRKLIVGLGNPGKEYRMTKHNVGFRVVDGVAQRENIALVRRKFNAQLGRGKYRGVEFYLAKPLTFMNLSGICVRRLADYFQIEPGNILIVFDDIHLPLGTLRLRASGSAGGHKGMESIINCLGTCAAARLRVGVAAGAVRGDLARYVLTGFKRLDLEAAEKMTVTAQEAVLCWIEQGMPAAMARFNKKGG